MTEIGVDDEFPGVTPQLTVADTDAAVRFYRAVFDADELLRNHDPPGRVMHCELLLGAGRLLLHDEIPEDDTFSPVTVGSTSVVLHVYVSDVDAVHANALAHNATELMAPQDTFWGERYAQFRDPFGHQWSIARRNQHVSVAELEERADNWSSQL
jgi:PhnB protein